MADERSDHELLICIEQKVTSLQEDTKELKKDSKVNQKGIIRHNEQVRTLFNWREDHEKGHRWWGLAIITIVGVIVTSGLMLATIIIR